MLLLPSLLPGARSTVLLLSQHPHSMAWAWLAVSLAIALAMSLRGLRKGSLSAGGGWRAGCLTRRQVLCGLPVLAAPTATFLF